MGDASLQAAGVLETACQVPSTYTSKPRTFGFFSPVLATHYIFFNN
jgi:hypothetical protein